MYVCLIRNKGYGPLQCSYIAVGTWYCGLIQYALWPSAYDFSTRGFCWVYLTVQARGIEGWG